MQMTNATTYLKLAGSLAIAGAIVGRAVSFAVPGRSSSAVIQMTERQDLQRPVPQDALDERFALQLGNFEEIYSAGASLEDMIRHIAVAVHVRHRVREHLVQACAGDWPN
jgi:hypothetical protein